MYQSHARSPQTKNGVADNVPRKSVKSIAETQENSFDEIESLRAEVKRLSDIVTEQRDLISYIQKTFNQKSKENNSIDSLDLLTELNQHKISLACLERDNIALTSLTKQLQSEVSSLSVTVGQQCNELLLLRSAIRDLYLGVSAQTSERSSTSPQLRSVSCSELQANCVSYNINGGGPNLVNEENNRQRQRITRSYTGRLPPPGNQLHQHIYQQRVNGLSQRKNSYPLKSGSSGKLNNLVMFLKSPKVSIRRPSSRSNKFQTNAFPLVEDEFSSSEHLSPYINDRTPSLLLPTNTDFEDWSLETVCDFLRQLGLDYCLAAARNWIKSGADIINASNAQLYQNLGLLRPLHLKKLLIHVSLRTTQDLMATRETAFLPSITPHPDFNITAWLEDIGLPMYKPTFEAELIDAYVLHELTLSEIQSMGVNNELHMLSMRRGLQLMRQLDFDLSRFCRRPIKSSNTNGSSNHNKSRSSGTPEDVSPTLSEMPTIMMDSAHSTPALILARSPSIKAHSNIHRSTSVSADTVCREDTPPQQHTPPFKSSSLSSASQPQSPASLALWSFHRVEAWLREIELPEYVSNLRNSGLHGALMVYEDRFTVETLADSLDIGPERTLLRRHLSEKFADLLGQSIWSRKQRSSSGIENCSGSAAVLNPSTKLKLINRRSSIKKIFDVSSAVSSSAIRYLGSDLLCPLEADFDFKNSAANGTS
ncbi:hypothetical protein Aperf_G00000073346 [Anoplocephala perfoliata]